MSHSDPTPSDLEALELSLAEPQDWHAAFDKLKPYEQQFLNELMIHGHPSKAALAVGFKSNWGKWALDAKPALKHVWDCMRLDRSRKLGITADMVLQALWEQFQRLTAMLDLDIAELYTPEGAMRPVFEWPEHWRCGMVREIETKDLFEYSKDGKQAGDSKTWDKIGETTKVKRESRLAIEKEIRETLIAIGRHVNVDAFVQNKPGDTNILVITADQARKVQSAKRRLERATTSEPAE